MDEQKNSVNGGMVEEGGSNGLIVGVILIIILIILGGLYFWNQRMNSGDTSDTSVVTDISQQSNSDTSSSIEEDLDMTDIENVDTALNAS